MVATVYLKERADVDLYEVPPKDQSEEHVEDLDYLEDED